MTICNPIFETLYFPKLCPTFIDNRTNFEMKYKNLNFDFNTQPKIQVLNWPYARHVERGSTDKIAFPFFQACANIFLKYLQLCQASSLFYITTPSVNYLSCKVNIFLKVYFRNLKKVSHTKWIEKWDLNKSCEFVKCHIIEYISIFERFYPSPRLNYLTHQILQPIQKTWIKMFTFFDQIEQVLK